MVVVISLFLLVGIVIVGLLIAGMIVLAVNKS